MLYPRQFLEDQVIYASSDRPEAPAVSVVLPTHSRRRSGMLERSMRSVLRQTMTDLELVLLDDGSQDGSFDLIEELRAKDPRVIHVRHERNSGIHSIRLNEGVELSRGRYVAFQFDDDVWRTHALQILLEEAQKHPDPTIVVGHSLFHGPTGEWTLPAVDVNLVSLYEQNRFANNGVLIPYSVIERHGMYDPHIGMRRLCDWDLWLRYFHANPFVVVDETISDVYESNPGSLGLTVPWDLPLFRLLHAIPRDGLLLPSNWREYPVDSLTIAGIELPDEVRRRLYFEQILPYYLRSRHHFVDLADASGVLPQPRRHALMTKNSYDVSNDVTLGHFDRAEPTRGSYKAHFEPLYQVTANWPAENDALLLVRTVEDRAKDLVTDALRSGKPVGLYLDDDLLSFHEYGDEFSYLAPQTPYHTNLQEIARAVDAVWVTNAFIRQSMVGLNPRVIPHNNCVPAASLPVAVRARATDRPLRIGYAGGAYRREEFEQIWPALEEFSRHHRDRVEFEFWGLDVSSFPRLHSSVRQRAFTFSYAFYLKQLQDAAFDILLTPLLETPRPRRGKSLIKYYEAAVASALGIFSDVPQYARLPGGVTCLKVRNDARHWHQALELAQSMSAAEFDRMRARALAHVREEYTDRAQLRLHEAAWHATEFHGRTRGTRGADGKPRVAYFLHSAHYGGGEIQLWRRLRLARSYGIEPIVVLPHVLRTTEAVLRLQEQLRQESVQCEFAEYLCLDQPRSPEEYSSDLEKAQLRELLTRCRPALVHSVTFIPSVGQVCREMRIPHVASLYAIDDRFQWPGIRPEFGHAHVVQSDSVRYTQRWWSLLGGERFVAREVVPEEVFDLGRERMLKRTAESETRAPVTRLAMTGTLQERKCQREAIDVLAALVNEGFDCRLSLYGYTHFFPEYVESCRRRAHEQGVSDRVAFPGFAVDVADVMSSADLVLSLSTFESFPSALKEAMAAGVLVVATPVGGIPELIVDGVSGILCRDTGVESMIEGVRRALRLSPSERLRIVEHARAIARAEFHPQRAASDLLRMYCRTLELEGTGEGSRSSASVTPPLQPAVPSGPIERLVSPSRPPGSHVLIPGHVSFWITPEDEGWTGIDAMVATHGRPASGTLRLQIRTADGGLIRESGASLADLRDHGWLAFRFAPVVNSSGKSFRLRFSLASAGAGTRLSLFRAAGVQARPLRLLRRVGIPLPGGQLYCRRRYVGPSMTTVEE